MISINKQMFKTFKKLKQVLQLKINILYYFMT